jgi:WD40 repeat protein
MRLEGKGSRGNGVVMFQLVAASVRHTFWFVLSILVIYHIPSVAAQDAGTIEVVPIIGHAGQITSAAVFSDGRLLLTGAEDNFVKLWEADTGHLLRTLQGHASIGLGGWSGIGAVAFSRDGHLAASGGVDRTVRIWKLSTGQLLQTIEAHERPITAVTFVSNDEYIVSACDDEYWPDGSEPVETLKLWRVTTGELVHTFGNYVAPVTAVVASEDGNTIMSAGKSKNSEGLKLWESLSGRLLVALSASGAEAKVTNFLTDGHSVISFVETPTGSHVRTWNYHTGVPFSDYAVSESKASPLAISSSGHIAVIVDSDRDDVPPSLELWQRTAESLVRRNVTSGTKLLPETVVALSPDGKVLVVSDGRTFALWDGGLLRKTRSFAGARTTNFLGFAKNDDALLLAGTESENQLIWNLKAPELRQVIDAPAINSWQRRGVFHFSNTTLAFEGETSGDDEVFRSPDYVVRLPTGKLTKLEPGERILYFDKGSDSRQFVTFSLPKSELRFWSVSSQAISRRISTPKFDQRDILGVAISPDLKWFAYTLDRSIELLDLVTGRKRKINVASSDGNPWAVAFSPSGRLLASATYQGKISVRNVANLQTIARFSTDNRYLQELYFMPNERLLYAYAGLGVWGRTSHVFDIESKKQISAHSCNKKCGHFLEYVGNDLLVNSTFASGNLFSLVRNFTVVRWQFGSFYEVFNGTTTSLEAIAVSTAGDKIAIAVHNRIQLFDLRQGQLIRELSGHLGRVKAIAFSPDGSRLASGSDDGSTRIWDPAKDQPLLVTLIAGPDAGWLAITPGGFFSSSGEGSKASEFASVVRGMRSYSLTHALYEKLARRDLVTALLNGDLLGEYREAASRTGLQAILDSGPAPQLVVLPDRTERTVDSVRISIRIFDTGGGIGPKVVWRVNGRSQGDNVAPAPTPEGFVEMTNILQINSKPNDVEVFAYNNRGLLASEPLRFRVDAFGSTGSGGARLFVLAIGVGPTYAMKDWRLDFPERDAMAISRTLEAAGRDLFVNVIPLALTGRRVTEREILAAFDRLRTEIKPDDVFVLFLSGHGMSRDGQYYYVPQDFDTSRGDTWDKAWIGAQKWEKWLNGIVANKQLLILDTCEGLSALGLVKGRAERETAMDQLRYATGRNIIAAASHDAREATELGHGILTYTILEALKKPSPASSVPNAVTVLQLAAFAQKEIPEIRQRIWGEYVGPVSRLTQNDFPLGFQIALEDDSARPVVQSMGRYVVIRDEQAREEPKPDSRINRPVAAFTEVMMIKMLPSGWALVGRDGSQWGWVPLDAVRPLI